MKLGKLSVMAWPASVIALFTGALISVNVPAASADQCPKPLYSVEPEISVKVSFDSKTRLYTYDYVLKNGGGASLPIDHWGIFSRAVPNTVRSPQGWEGEFMDNAPVRTSWMSALSLSESDLPDHKWDIKPGQSLSGFSISSPQAPGIVRAFFEGPLDSVPTTVGTGAVDEPAPNCPGFGYEGPTGPYGPKLIAAVEGPADASAITAKLELRGEISSEDLEEEKLQKDKKKLHVTLFGSDKLDVGKVDMGSIRFGTAQAKAFDAKVLPVSAEVSKSKVVSHEPKRIELTFNLKDVGVRCDLDLALFLSGKVGDAPFLGAVPIKRSPCGKEGPERRNLPIKKKDR